MKKIKEFKVQSNSDYLIWQIDTTNFADKVKFFVDTGCSLLYYENGGYCDEYQPGSSYDIDLKKNAKKGKSVGLVGVNSEKEFKILFGVGGIPFHDRPVRLNPLVGIHGECTLRVLNGAKIRNKFGAASEAIGVDEVSEKLRIDLQAPITAILTEKLGEYTYNSLGSATVEIGKAVEEELRKLFQAEGLLLIRCSVSAPCFPEDYAKERNAVLGNEAEKAEKEDDLSILTKLAEKGITASGGDKEQTCPNCGAIVKDAKFCPKCGREIK